jgi:hypothetical protein
MAVWRKDKDVAEINGIRKNVRSNFRLMIEINLKNIKKTVRSARVRSERTYESCVLLYNALQYSVEEVGNALHSGALPCSQRGRVLTFHCTMAFCSDVLLPPTLLNEM